MAASPTANTVKGWPLMREAWYAATPSRSIRSTASSVIRRP